jgi:hypothetical protein
MTARRAFLAITVKDQIYLPPQVFAKQAIIVLLDPLSLLRHQLHQDITLLQAPLRPLSVQ